MGKRWKEHFGCTPFLQSKSSPVWIHAVSVGEVIAISPLIKKLKKQHPLQVILLTTTTPTGAEQAIKLGDLIEHRYMPIDFSFAVRSFIKKTQPTQLLIMETELWPNTLHAAAEAGLTITIVNARLSQRSANRYAKVPPIFNLLAENISKLLCQHEDDAQRFIKLGIAAEKIEVTGSIKFDIEITPQIKDTAKQLKQDLGSRPIWIAASTHQGEDEKVLDAHNKLLTVFPNALLILVPRHPERFNDAYTLCQRSGFKIVRRSNKEDVPTACQVYLADTMGEMLILLGAADICFMGGSLIGDKVGGHNLLEPAALGLPSLTGPSFFNFTDITEQLKKNNSTNVINNAEQLSIQLINLFDNEEELNQRGQAALAVVRSNKGAIQKTLNHLNFR